MQNVFLKPAVPGAIVPDPETHQPLKAEGEWKPQSMYWARRILDKDVIEATPPKEAAPVAPPPADDAAPARSLRSPKS